MSKPTARELLGVAFQYKGNPPTELAVRVEKVLAQHERDEEGWCMNCTGWWPCSTVRALDGDE